MLFGGLSILDFETTTLRRNVGRHISDERRLQLHRYESLETHLHVPTLYKSPMFVCEEVAFDVFFACFVTWNAGNEYNETFIVSSHREQPQNFAGKTFW